MVSLKYLGEEFENSMDEFDFWFDRETEQVIFVDTYNYSFDDDDEDNGESKHATDKEYLYNKNNDRLIKNNPGRFVQLPSKYELHEWQIMSDFVEEMPDGGPKEDLRDSIQGKGAFRNFRFMVERLYLLENWYAFKSAAYRDKAREWCEDNDIAYTE